MRDPSTVALKPRELSELVRGPAFVLDEEGRVLGCNRAAAAALGMEPERVEGGRLADVLADGGPAEAELAAALAPGGAGPWPARLRSARGPLACQLRAVVPAAARRCLLVTVEADGEPAAEIAQLRAALEIVRSLLDRFGARLFPLEQGLLLVSHDGRIEHATNGTTDMLGLPVSQLLGAPVAEVAARLDLRGLDAGPEPGEETTTCTLRRPDGRERILRHRAVPLMADDGGPLGTLHAFYDATATIERTHELAEKSRELDEARARLTRAQHLKALGQLAAEVAHEFGNLLQAIGLQAAALRRAPMLPEPVMRSLWSIKQAVDIGQALTRRLLTFARDDPNERMEAFDVGRVLRDLVQLLEPRLNKGGRPLRVELSLPQLPEVMGSQNKLTEAFLNLFLNALDAMPDGGVLQVSATESSGEIRIAVRDSGKGMTREELARAFDPFFTTKPGGTGLGLSTVYGVVRSHGGSVFLESEPGEGHDGLRLAAHRLPAGGGDAAGGARPSALRGVARARRRRPSDRPRGDDGAARGSGLRGGERGQRRRRAHRDRGAALHRRGDGRRAARSPRLGGGARRRSSARATRWSCSCPAGAPTSAPRRHGRAASISSSRSRSIPTCSSRRSPARSSTRRRRRPTSARGRGPCAGGAPRGGISLRPSESFRSWSSATPRAACSASARIAVKALAMSSFPGTRTAVGIGSTVPSRATTAKPSRRGRSRSTTTTSGRTTPSSSVACFPSQAIDTDMCRRAMAWRRLMSSSTSAPAVTTRAPRTAYGPRPVRIVSQSIGRRGRLDDAEGERAVDVGRGEAAPEADRRARRRGASPPSRGPRAPRGSR